MLSFSKMQRYHYIKNSQKCPSLLQKFKTFMAETKNCAPNISQFSVEHSCGDIDRLGIVSYEKKTVYNVFECAEFGSFEWMQINGPQSIISHLFHSSLIWIQAKLLGFYSERERKKNDCFFCVLSFTFCHEICSAITMSWQMNAESEMGEKWL